MDVEGGLGHVAIDGKRLCGSASSTRRGSLDPAVHGPGRLLQLSRDHWQIENCLFHVRDVTCREDRCRVGSGSAPQALAEIRTAALNLIRKTWQKPRPAREAFAEQQWKAIRLVKTA